MDFPVESYSFLPGSRAILDLSYRSRLRNSNYTMSQQSRPTMSMLKTLAQRYQITLCAEQDAQMVTLLLYLHTFCHDDSRNAGERIA